MTKHIIKIFLEISDLLKDLSQEQYTRRLEILSDSSIGKHVRHILEFYQCLFEAVKNHEVNYDNRKRDLHLEIDIHFASKTIEMIINELLEVKKDFTVSFVANYSIDENEQAEKIQSSFYRELAYNLEHRIRHQVLIKVAITDMQLTSLVNDIFGYTPSTIRNVNKLCAQ